MTRRGLFWGLVLVLAGLVGGGLFVFNEMKKPLFVSGEVRAADAAALDPPPQGSDPDFWQVTPKIQLHHFAEGSGPPVLVVHGGPGLPFAEPLPGLSLLAENHTFHYYDQRGSGQSSRPFDRFEGRFMANMTTLEATLGLGAQIAHIERIRRILGVQKLTPLRQILAEHVP